MSIQLKVLIVKGRMEIFRATNNIKNVETRDKPQEKIQNVCKRIQATDIIDSSPQAITENKSGKAKLRRMDLKELYNPCITV